MTSAGQGRPCLIFLKGPLFGMVQRLGVIHLSQGADKLTLRSVSTKRFIYQQRGSTR